MLRVCYELLLVWLLWQRLVGWGANDWLTTRALTTSQPWQRHPQSPRDCPGCQAARGSCQEHETRGIEPWFKRKSKRGRPKTVETDGYCCNNPACPYYNITDSRVHALVGYGKHHGADTIQYVKCQACHTKISVR